MLEFCPVCRNLLMIEKVDDKTIGRCSCGFKRTNGIDLSSVDRNDMDNLKSGEGIVSENKTEGVDRVCKKCGYDKAEMSELQSGESSIFIYTCLSCKSVEREVQGSSKF